MGNFIQLMADDETLEYLEEGFKKLQVILFTCLYFYLFIQLSTDNLSISFSYMILKKFLVIRKD